jgi:hypothetical protein
VPSQGVGRLHYIKYSGSGFREKTIDDDAFRGAQIQPAFGPQNKNAVNRVDLFVGERHFESAFKELNGLHTGIVMRVSVLGNRKRSAAKFIFGDPTGHAHGVQIARGD